LLVDGPIPEMRVQWWAALGVSVPLGGITVFLMSLAIKAHRNKIVTGKQGLIGEIGVARTPLSPEGKVFVHGELWNAISSEPVPVGGSIVVNRVSEMTLEVAPAPKTQPVSAN
jgi:membrane-bound serine protease (ClpP class)